MAKVLLVDDHVDLRGVIRELLEMSGHAVDCANCADEANAAIASAENRGNPFDVVVADYHMPGQNGFDFLVKLVDTRRFLTVLCSGDDNHKDRALDAGIDDFWVKGADSFYDHVERLDERLAVRTRG